jgi:peptide/nickel transport system permease protein
MSEVEYALTFGVIWRRFKKHRLAFISLVVVLGIAILTIAAPFIAPYDPFETNVGNSFEPPSWKHLFGTDKLGRDLLSRVIWGGRPTYFIGLLSTALSTVIGLCIGAISGYFGRFIDQIFMRITDMILVIPFYFLCIVTVALMGSRSPLMIALLIGFLNWPTLARIVRSEFLSHKERPYVVAAKVVGAGTNRIIFRHILPNIMGPVIVTVTSDISFCILVAASLDFLGLGDPTQLAWGTIMTKGGESLRAAPWIMLFPGIMLLLVVLGLNLVGDGLRDAMDPRLARRGRV